MPKGIKYVFIIIFAQFLSFSIPANAQTLPDFENLKVEELSDDEINSLMQQASQMGYSQQDLFSLARQRGLSLSQISLLGQRINKPSTVAGRVSSAQRAPQGRSRSIEIDTVAREVMKSEIFGLSIFQNGNAQRGFQTDLNIPTPDDYILGPGDEIFIDLYGDSETYYQTEVNSEGTIILQNFGPIVLSGLSIKEAKERLKNKVFKDDLGLQATPPTTFISVTLGKIRSINIDVVGEVKVPGTYTVSALSTVFNALYAVGGITENGTLRNIKVLRSNKLIAELDAYNFLIYGNNKSNIQLRSNDVILVDPYVSRVEIKGAIKRPAFYELKDSEMLSDLIKYAGGFREDSFAKQIKVTRNVGGEKVIADVFEDQFEVFNPKSGDVYEVAEVLNRFTNRVQVKGAVFRPGEYSMAGNSSLKQLIDKADGLRGDANLERALIIRTKPDLSTETISVNLRGLMDGSVPDITLQREDILQVFSIYDLKEEVYVEVSGHVNSEGALRYSENMTVEDALVLAGGFQTSASDSRIEVTRRQGDAELGQVSEIFILNVSRDLSINEEDKKFVLQPFDHVMVRANPDFSVQKFVAVEGEVKYPGKYAIQNQNERISSLLKRAGGVNNYAYIEGATLLRKTEFHSELTNVDQKVRALESLLDRYSEGDISLSEAELAQVKRVNKQLGDYEEQSLEVNGNPFYAKNERLREIVQRNSLFGDVQLGDSDAVGINLDRILKEEGSKYDLILEEGDVLVLPKLQETVRLRGRVLYPTTVVYEPNKKLRYFINMAGGFGNRAQAKNTYVIYANGSVARTKNFLFFKSYPKVAPGAEIVIPAKPPKLPMAISELVGVTSGLATLALLISQINFR